MWKKIELDNTFLVGLWMYSRKSFPDNLNIMKHNKWNKLNINGINVITYFYYIYNSTFSFNFIHFHPILHRISLFGKNRERVHVFWHAVLILT